MDCRVKPGNDGIQLTGKADEQVAEKSLHFLVISAGWG
jgi:hypothetical protein